MKRLKQVVLMVLLIFFGLVIFWFFGQFCGPGESGEDERFVVGLKATKEEITDELQIQGFIKNKKLFWIFYNFRCWQRKSCPDLEKEPEPGAYLISKKMNLYQLAGTFIYGPYQKWVLIPPGKRKEQVALILSKTLNWSDILIKNFIDLSKEGYLYPDTYLIETASEPKAVAQKLAANFNDKFDAQLQKDLLKQNIRNDTAVKIASLIERESGGEEDKPIIAAIIWNRLNKRMRLEIDATVQYAITSAKCKVESGKLRDCDFWPRLGARVVRTINSPYNTYLIKALPPGPICSPSLSSLKAVAYPAETDALYYLHSSDKQIHTARTYKEHQENIKKYL